MAAAAAAAAAAARAGAESAPLLPACSTSLIWAWASASAPFALAIFATHVLVRVAAAHSAHGSKGSFFARSLWRVLLAIFPAPKPPPVTFVGARFIARLRRGPATSNTAATAATVRRQQGCPPLSPLSRGPAREVPPSRVSLQLHALAQRTSQRVHRRVR